MKSHRPTLNLCLIRGQFRFFCQLQLSPPVTKQNKMWSDMVKRVTETPVGLGWVLMIQSVSIILRIAGAEAPRFLRDASEANCGFINNCCTKFLGGWNSEWQPGPQPWPAELRSPGYSFFSSCLVPCRSHRRGTQEEVLLGTHAHLPCICLEFPLSLLPLGHYTYCNFFSSKLLTLAPSGLLTVTLLQLLYVGSTWFLLSRFSPLFIIS